MAKNKYISLVNGILEYCVRKDLLRCAKIAIFFGASPDGLPETSFYNENSTTKYIYENYFEINTDDVRPKPQSKLASWFAWLPSFSFLSWFKGNDVLAEARQLNLDINNSVTYAQSYNEEQEQRKQQEAPTRELMEKIDADIQSNEDFLQQFEARKRARVNSNEMFTLDAELPKDPAHLKKRL